MIQKQFFLIKAILFSLVVSSFFALNLSDVLASKNDKQELKSQVYKWSHVGESQGTAFAEDSATAINPTTKQPWVIYKDGSRLLTVKRFDGENWITVGNLTDIVGVSDDTSDNVRPEILFHPTTNVPYITFQITDGSTDSVVRVKKYIGNSWVNVGLDIQDSGESVCSPDLNFSESTGKLYLLVTGNGNDCNYYGGNGNNNDERDARVYEFDGSNWSAIDMTGVSTISKARAVSLSSDSLGNLYLAVVDKEAYPDEVSVWKNDGVAWTSIANASNFLVNGDANDVNIEIDSSGAPWVAVKSKKSGYDYLAIYKFDGANMVKVGENVFSEENGISLKNRSRISFKLDSSNVPYVSFVERINSTGSSFLAIKRYLDDKWDDVGISRLYKQNFSTNNNLDFLEDSLYATYENEDSQISIVRYAQEIVEIGNWWQPKGYEHLSWQWQLSVPVDPSLNVDMYDIDLFDVSESTISNLKDNGKIVICYISAGSIEYGSSRPDQQELENISPSVIGNVMENWSSEKWLNINNSEVRNIMSRRLDLAVSKGCDGIEPDNINAWEVDAVNNWYKTGFNITEEQQIDYNIWLANEAHKKGLSIGLKNDIGVDTSDVTHISKLVDYFDWALNEQCYEYDECEVYSVFDNANKAVFGVEYNLGVENFCDDANTHGRYWMQKNQNPIDGWRDACQQNSEKPEKTSIYRLYNTRTGVHLYTRGLADRDKILAKWTEFEFTDGVPAFYASTIDDGNTPIYRLYNTRTGVHLYTRGIIDRNKILNKYPDFEFTDFGPAFYASLVDDGTTPIFRLYNTRTGVHLYTRGVADRVKILSKYPDFEFTDGEAAFFLKTS